VGNVYVTNVDQSVTVVGRHANNDMANVDVPPAHTANDNVDKTKTTVNKKRKRDKGSNASMEGDTKKNKKNTKESKTVTSAKQLTLRSNISDPPVPVPTILSTRHFQFARIEDISSKFANQRIKGWPFKCPSMYVAYSNIIPFNEINAVINYIQNEMFRPGKLSGKTTAQVFTMIHRFIIKGEVAGLKAILPWPSRKDVITPFIVTHFKQGMDCIVNIVKNANVVEPTSFDFVKRYILYYQFIAQFCLAQMGMINTYHDVDLYSDYYHDPKTFTYGKNLHQYIIHQHYSDLLKAFNSPSLIKDMKSMNVKRMKTVVPDVLNLEYLKKMCAKQLNYILPLCCDSVLVPLVPLPADQHSPTGKDVTSSLSETQSNVDQVSSTLLSVPFPTAPADDEAPAKAPAPTPKPPAPADADVFDINHFSRVSPQVHLSKGEC
jgi:hypothetical protein